ncbi:hypothetical protein ACHAXS_006740 [Conticribra weissflogii]
MNKSTISTTKGAKHSPRMTTASNNTLSTAAPASGITSMKPTIQHYSSKTNKPRQSTIRNITAKIHYLSHNLTKINQHNSQTTIQPPSCYPTN